MSAVVSAEGPFLFTTGPAIAASDLTGDLGNRIALKQAVRVTLNKAALESKVISVRLEGKTYRYVGTKKDTGGDGATWNGRAADGSSLWVSHSPSGAAAQIAIGRRMFLIVYHAGEPILVEID